MTQQPSDLRRSAQPPTPKATAATAASAPDLADDLAFERRLSEATEWRHRVALVLLAADLAAIGLAVLVAYLGRFGTSASIVINGIYYPVLAGVLVLGWVGLLAAFHCYESRLLGVGTEEFRRVLAATFALFGVVATVSYLGKFEITRGFVVIALPLGVVLLVLGRLAARRWVQAQRSRGQLRHRVVVVGDHAAATALAAQLAREPYAGFSLVGVCLPVALSGETPEGLPVLGRIEETLDVVRRHGADTVAVAASSDVAPDLVRRLAWSLEGSGVDLVVAPAVTDVAGPRIAVRPVGGLPLLYVDEPTFTGGTRVLKRAIDIAGAGLGLLVLSPLLVTVAALIRLTSSGPALFRQTRIGKDGREFRVVKFRTMYVDAEARLADLQADNESDGLLFKIAHDPRITVLGRVLRRTSIDELPQLLNVLRGDMSLVGPRPLPVKDSAFEGHVRRRLLVRPGITGLWQVSGRSQTSWDDAVRLDLYYVENWSLSLDLTILMRTVLAVVRGEGAY